MFALGLSNQKGWTFSLFHRQTTPICTIDSWVNREKMFSPKTKTSHLFSKTVKMKISPTEDTCPVTKTSLFLRFLVKMCFIMIKKTGDDNMKFSYAKLIWYLIGSYGWLVSGFVISQMGINDTLVNTQYQVLKESYLLLKCFCLIISSSVAIKKLTTSHFSRTKA